MKTIVSLIGSALAAMGASAAVAQSNVTVFGIMDVFVGRVTGAPGVRSGEQAISSLNGGGLSTSTIGFRGREDLGDGAYAAFELSSFTRPDTGQSGRSEAVGPPVNVAADPFWSRSAWVGLGHTRYGSLRLGNGPTLMWINALTTNALGATTNFSPIALVMFVGGPLSGGTSWTNQVVLDSAEFGGFSFGLAAAAAEGQGRRSLGAQVSYRQGAWTLGLAWQDVKKNPLTFADGTSLIQTGSWLLSGSYDMKWARLFANAGAIRDHGTPTTPANRNYKIWSVSSAVPIGLGRVLLGVASRSTDDVVGPAPATVPGGNISRRVATVGYDYYLSKRTDVYLLARSDQTVTRTLPAPPRNIDASSTSFALGVRHTF